MDRTVLQIPMPKTLKIKAEKAALDLGFSSLQETLRVFMKKLASRVIDISFQEGVTLSPRAVKRYDKIIKDIEEGKNVYHAKSVDDLMKHLSE